MRMKLNIYSSLLFEIIHQYQYTELNTCTDRHTKVQWLGKHYFRFPSELLLSFQTNSVPYSPLKSNGIIRREPFDNIHIICPSYGNSSRRINDTPTTINWSEKEWKQRKCIRTEEIDEFSNEIELHQSTRAQFVFIRLPRPKKRRTDRNICL